MTIKNDVCEPEVNWKDYFEYEKMKVSNLSFNYETRLIPNNSHYDEIFENHLKKVFSTGEKK